jgi:hypothetical protein
MTTFVPAAARSNISRIKPTYAARDAGTEPSAMGNRRTSMPSARERSTSDGIRRLTSSLILDQRDQETRLEHLSKAPKIGLEAPLPAPRHPELVFAGRQGQSDAPRQPEHVRGEERDLERVGDGGAGEHGGGPRA